MRSTHWATYLWPGLPQLWAMGSWSGLLLAVGFAALLNLLLVASFVWVQLLDGSLLTFGWAALGLVWVSAPLVSGWSKSTAVAEPSVDLFRQAQAEYLKGNWFEAETLLAKRLEQVPLDAEARLLLATLLRHVRRYEEARRQLAHLEKLEGSLGWQVEIASERRRLDELSPKPATLFGVELPEISLRGVPADD